MCVFARNQAAARYSSRIVEARRAEVARRQRIVPETVLRIAVQKGRSAARFCRRALAAIAST